MRLQYLPANQAWTVVLGTLPVRMGDGPLFFETRTDAVRAANRQGIHATHGGDLIALDCAEEFGACRVTGPTPVAAYVGQAQPARVCDRHAHDGLTSATFRRLAERLRCEP